MTIAGSYSSVSSDVAWESVGTTTNPLWPFFRGFKKSNCQVMAKECVLRSTGNLPRGGLPRNIVDRITDLPNMTSAIYRGREALTKRTKQQIKQTCLPAHHLQWESENS